MKLPVGYVAGVGVVKATAYGGYGQRMLEKMGWEKGDGLGKGKDGMKSAIEAKEKKDSAGVGADKSMGWDWRNRFWEDAYDSAAKNIDLDNDSSSSSTSGSESGSSSSSSSSDSDSDDDGTAVIVNRDGTVTSASIDERKLAAQLAKDPWGRFGGRGGKMARIKMQEEKEAQEARAKLGVDEAAAKSAGPAKTSSESEKKPEEPKKKRIVVTLKIKEDPDNKRAKFVPTPATGWWGAAYFRSAGNMGGMEEEDEEDGQERDEDGSRKRKSFNEDDQTALYMKVHDNQRVGRKGLGKSDKLKIAGGKWEGSKKSFDEEGEDSKGGAEQERKGKKRARTSSVQEEVVVEAVVVVEEEEADEDGGEGAPKIKWLKVVKELLKDAPNRRMKLEKLCKKLMKHQEKHHHHHHHHHHHKSMKSKDKVEGLVMKKVKSCEKLSLTKGRVTLQ